MVSACPRPSILVISVTSALRCCSLNEAWVIDQGTVWSLPPPMNSIGPRRGFSVSTFASVQGLKFSAAAWNSGSPRAGTAKVSYSCLASSSLTALAKA